MKGEIRLEEIRTGIETVPPEAVARLHEKQWRAKVWMKQNPFANAMNAKLKSHLQRVATVTELK
jgi:hypothetical protein